MRPSLPSRYRPWPYHLLSVALILLPFTAVTVMFLTGALRQPDLLRRAAFLRHCMDTETAAPSAEYDRCLALFQHGHAGAVTP